MFYLYSFNFIKKIDCELSNILIFRIYDIVMPRPQHLPAAAPQSWPADPAGRSQLPCWLGFHWD